MTSSQVEPVGLRERKKAKTRAAIQDTALRLYLEQGYEATTVEQIAAAAEVSPSTFFRYFPTKAETVYFDRLDPILMESFVNQPAELTPIQAIKAAMHEVLDALSEDEFTLEATRWQLVTTMPELRAAMGERIGPLIDMVCDGVATRMSRDPHDFEVRTWTGAMVGAMLAAAMTALDGDGDFIAAIDAGLDHLEAGLPL
jgi:AcrR family transcriptional regulator